MRTQLLALCVLCIMLSACTSDEPKPAQADTWIIKYRAIPQSVPTENKQSFVHWCETHENLMQYSVPGRDLYSFSYESAIALKWIETTTSETDAVQKAKEFNSVIGENNLTTAGATYRKYEPEFNGTWRISFVETFSLIHNDSDAFNRWYNDNLSYLQSASFLLFNQNLQWEYPSTQHASSFYDKSIFGTLTWYVEISNVSEQEVQRRIQQFQSFSIVDNTKNGYDTFVADYSPITSSKAFP